MLIRIKNAILVKARRVKVLRTKVNIKIAEILKVQGFIDSFGDVPPAKNEFVYKYIWLNLKYRGPKQKSCITGLKRISKSGSRVYVNSKNLPKVLGGVGIAVFAECFNLKKIFNEIKFYIFIKFLTVVKEFEQ